MAGHKSIVINVITFYCFKNYVMWTQLEHFGQRAKAPVKLVRLVVLQTKSSLHFRSSMIFEPIPGFLKIYKRITEELIWTKLACLDEKT